MHILKNQCVYLKRNEWKNKKKLNISKIGTFLVNLYQHSSTKGWFYLLKEKRTSQFSIASCIYALHTLNYSLKTEIKRFFLYKNERYRVICQVSEGNKTGLLTWYVPYQKNASKKLSSLYYSNLNKNGIILNFWSNLSEGFCSI